MVQSKLAIISSIIVVFLLIVVFIVYKKSQPLKCPTCSTSPTCPTCQTGQTRPTCPVSEKCPSCPTCEKCPSCPSCPSCEKCPSCPTCEKCETCKPCSNCPCITVKRGMKIRIKIGNKYLGYQVAGNVQNYVLTSDVTNSVVYTILDSTNSEAASVLSYSVEQGLFGQSYVLDPPDNLPSLLFMGTGVNLVLVSINDSYMLIVNQCAVAFADSTNNLNQHSVTAYGVCTLNDMQTTSQNKQFTVSVEIVSCS